MNDFQPNKVCTPSSWTMANDGNTCFSTWARINLITWWYISQHSSLRTLKQSGFYPWLTCPPRIWSKNQPPTTETSVGCASRNNPWELLLWDAGCITQHGPRATGNSLPRSGRNLRAKIKKTQLLQRRVPQDFQQVCSPIGTGFKGKAPGVLERGRMGIYSPAGGWHIEKGTFMPCKPQSSKNLAFVGGRPYYHLDGAKCKRSFKPQVLAW